MFWQTLHPLRSSLLTFVRPRLFLFFFLSFFILFPARQISSDVEHSESGLAKSLLSSLVQNLSEAGVCELDLLVAAKAEEGGPASRAASPGASFLSRRSESS